MCRNDKGNHILRGRDEDEDKPLGVFRGMASGLIVLAILAIIIFLIWAGCGCRTIREAGQDAYYLWRLY